MPYSSTSAEVSGSDFLKESRQSGHFLIAGHFHAWLVGIYGITSIEPGVIDTMPSPEVGRNGTSALRINPEERTLVVTTSPFSDCPLTRGIALEARLSRLHANYSVNSPTATTPIHELCGHRRGQVLGTYEWPIQAPQENPANKSVYIGGHFPIRSYDPIELLNEIHRLMPDRTLVATALQMHMDDRTFAYATMRAEAKSLPAIEGPFIALKGPL